MAENILNFKKAIRNPARSTLFRVQLVFPGNDNSQIDSFFCKGAQVPSFTQNPIEVSYMARKVKWPGDRNYEDFPVIIYNDADFTIRRKMERWMEIINTTKSNEGENDYTKYQTNMTVFHLDNAQKVVKTYTFVNAWPQGPGDSIDLNWENNDQVEEFPVNFAFDYWTSDESK